MKAFPSQGYKERGDRIWDDRDKEWKPYTVDEKVEHSGMELRDYFAAKAMQGLLSNPEYFTDVGGTDKVKTSLLAYTHADAMMEARKK